MRLRYYTLFLFEALTNLISVVISLNTIDFSVQYFFSRGIRMVSLGHCGLKDSTLYRRFSDKGILLKCFDPENADHDFLKNIFTSKYVKLGILIDMKCNGSFEVLNMVNENYLFRKTRSITSWLILLDKHILSETVEETLRSYEPNISDPVKYLTEPYDDTENSDLLLKFNREVNADFLKNYKRVVKEANNKSHVVRENILSRFFILDLRPDIEMTLAIPGPTGGNILFDLYDIYKQTKETKVVMDKYASVIFNNESLQYQERDNFFPNLTKRNDFGGALLKGGSAMLHVHDFVAMGDLSTRHIDVWTKMTYVLVSLLAEDLNFKIIVRFFDDYGWKGKRAGEFNGLMAHLQELKCDIAATGLLLREDRFPVIDHMDSPYRLQVGIVFRQPALSAVSNIFILPFSSTVWISIAGLAIIIALTLSFHLRYGRSLESNETLNYLDVVSYIIGAVCQQGFYVNPSSYSARMIIIFLLLASLALFTSFSATIVALLQSPSSSIRSVEDLTSSKMEAGIQSSFPFFPVYYKESNHRVVREYYIRKIASKGEKAYYNPEEGIQKVRNGMFAYSVELSTGYKIISETYQEKEKCGLKELSVFAKPYMGTAVPKNSPYKELLARRLRWQWEVGLTARTWKRWMQQKPKCESGRTGFVSVGLTDFHPAILVVIYGMSASCAILILELLVYYRNKYLRLLRRKRL